jgi:hypothetical protein
VATYTGLFCMQYRRVSIQRIVKNVSLSNAIMRLLLPLDQHRCRYMCSVFFFFLPLLSLLSLVRPGTKNGPAGQQAMLCGRKVTAKCKAGAGRISVTRLY